MSRKSAEIKALQKRLDRLQRPATTSEPMSIRPSALDALRGRSEEARTPFNLYTPPPGVLPESTTANDIAMAADWDPGASYAFATQTGWGNHGFFPGFPALAELAQRAEYRMISETIAEEMTRKWITLQSTGDDDKTDKIAELKQALDDFCVQVVFRKVTEHDGFFGRGQIFIDTGADDARLALPLVVKPETIGKGKLKGFRAIEPIWTYPNRYNAANPLADDFYRPQTWFVMGKEVHRSRLMTLVSREMPDMLKPAYAFAGLSLSQMVMVAVERWFRTSQSIEDLIHSFSTMVLSTDMSQILNGGGAETINNRAQMFSMMRDNRGLMTINKDTEEFLNVSTPLGTLDHLWAQSQEHMASVAGIPLVKLLGVTPSGLNASSDGEIRTFYDKIAAKQERLYAKPLRTVIDIVQLHLWGAIDPDITFGFDPLWQLDDAAKMANRKTQADTDAVYIQEGVISPEQVLTRLAGDPESPYHGLSVDEMPDAPPGMEQFEEGIGGDPSASAETGAEERDGT